MSAEPVRQLAELEALLKQRGESCWVQGVSACRLALELGDHEGAKSIYKSMFGGAGSFADLNFWHEDFRTRRKLNEPLDRLRDGIWDSFNL